jgi:uncharacterized protein
MDAAGRLCPQLATIDAVDHHAHLLAGPDTTIRLRDVLSESRDPAQIVELRWHPAYRRALRELAEVLGVEPSEDAVAAARANDYAAYVQGLLDRCRLVAMFVDDGFRFPGAMTFDQHADVVGRPVRRVVRIESEAEAAALGGGWPSFEQCRDRFQRAIVAAVAGDSGAVALKTIAAYRCGLDLPRPNVAAASAAYARWRTSGSRRLTDAMLVSVFVADALDATGRRLPLQVHTGLGDADLIAPKADPLHLQAHLNETLRDIPIVLLHTYPFVRQAGYLASIYPNVYVDLSLAITVMPHRGTELILEALELTPATKLLFATDASRLPEVFLLATRWWRASLTKALGRLVEDDYLDLADALSWAQLILADNARRVYGFEPV